jgi:hypothetical protein
MLVYISSSGERYKDKTTSINVGDHPFIRKPSWVRYQNIITTHRNELEGIIIEYFGPVSDNLLIRIQNGIHQSKFVKRRDKELFDQLKFENLSKKLK